MGKLYFECTYCGESYETSWPLSICAKCGDTHLRRLRHAEKYDVFGYGDDEDDSEYFEPLD